MIILGLEFLRARLLRLCCTVAFPPIFLQLRKEPLLFWGMLGRGDGGWRGIRAAGRGYNEVLALEVRNVVLLRRTKEKFFEWFLQTRFC